MQLIKENLVLDLNFTQGTAKDFSGNGNDGTLTNSEGFSKNKNGHAYKPQASNGHILVSDSASLQLTEGTFVIYGDFFNNFQADQVFIDKRDGGGTNYLIYASASNQLRFYDGSTDSIFTVAVSDYQQAKTLTIVKSSGSSAAQMYIDGIYHSDASLSTELTVNDAPLVIANINTLANGLKFGQSLNSLLIYSDEKTAAEVSQIHKSVITRRTPFLKKNKFFTAPSVKNEADRISGYNCKLVGGKLIDQSQGSDLSVIQGSVDNTRTPWGEPAIKLQNDAYLEGSDYASEDYTNGISFEAFIKTTDTQGDIIDHFNAVDPFTGWSFSVGGTANNGKLAIFTSSDTAGSYTADTGAAVNDGIWHHVVATYDFSNVRFYVDGELRSTVARTTGLGNSTAVVRLGASTLASPSRILDGEVARPKVYNNVLSLAQIQSEWNRVARLPIINEDFSDAYITQGTFSTGNPLPGTQWTVGAQAASITNGVNTGDKALKAGGFGHFSYIPMSPDRKHGRYIWKYKADVTAGYRNRLSFSSINTAITSGTYIIIDGQESGKLKVASSSDSNHLTTAAGSIVDGQVYEIWLDVTSKTTNNCTLYIDGVQATADSGANPFTYTNWGLLNWAFLAPYNSSEAYLFRQQFGVPV